MIRLLGKASSINVRKVLWACDEIGVPFEREDWGLGFRSAQSPEFMALNPNGLVPVIVDEDNGGFVLWESNTICRYLAGRQCRGDLLPTEPQARAQLKGLKGWGNRSTTRARSIAPPRTSIFLSSTGGKKAASSSKNGQGWLEA